MTQTVFYKYAIGQRVRIKFGVDRGHYGTIIHHGGDSGPYYGVKLDCRDNSVGYSEYELEAESTDKIAVNEVAVIAQPGTEFGIVSNANGRLTLICRRSGEEWPHDENPQSGCNVIQEGFSRYVVILQEVETNE